ncbi:unnamed protein product [Prunus armeniaca]|uniref:Uncharacterized protein n=1 Tax=Prunus armeniaca TaxID=36596 RepID=A0A6J5WJB3_PRUAR|nr:unnamed protein product [Prunus armeniaca]
MVHPSKSVYYSVKLRDKIVFLGEYPLVKRPSQCRIAFPPISVKAPPKRENQLTRDLPLDKSQRDLAAAPNNKEVVEEEEDEDDASALPSSSSSDVDELDSIP